MQCVNYFMVSNFLWSFIPERSPFDVGKVKDFVYLRILWIKTSLRHIT